MTRIKSFTVGLPVTELKRAVEWYRQLLGEVEEVNPAPWSLGIPNRPFRLVAAL